MRKDAGRRIQQTVPNLRRSGPTVQIRIEPILDLQELLQSEGENVPFVNLTALVDTGASATTIRSSALHGLSLDPVSTVFFSTPSTEEPQIRFQYLVRVVLTEKIAFDRLRVVEAPLGGQDVQCLIGRDILENAVLTYDGPKNRFALTFARQDDDDNP